MTQIAMILSGCGYLDGAEVREAVISMLALERAGAKVQLYAPDEEQHHVVDHVSGEEAEGETRNVMVEAARLARGDIKPLTEANAENFDALFMPGGFGMAKNLSDVAFKGADASVHAGLEKLIRDFYDAKKPIGAVCIAPAILAAALKDHNVKVTLGKDENNMIAGMGCQHQESPTGACVVDEQNHIVTAPAYMSEAPISEVADGIEAAVKALMEMVRR